MDRQALRTVCSLPVPPAGQPRPVQRQPGQRRSPVPASAPFSRQAVAFQADADLAARPSQALPAQETSTSRDVDLLERSLAAGEASSSGEQVADRLPASTRAAASTSTSTSTSSSNSLGIASSSRRVVLEDAESLKSSWEHRAWVWGACALQAGLLAKGLSGVHDLPTAAGALAALASSYVLADLGTGIYHWAVDNYGDGSTPVFGDQIAAFQGHHVRPWTITEREFANNVHKVFKPTVPFTALFLALSPWTPAPVDVFVGSFTFLVAMSQQFHAWSHMKRSELPAAVVALQESGVLISRRAHGAHHKAPFEGNYCIVSGLWNPWLDANGSPDGAFRRAERWLARRSGVEPRCWYEPEYGWEPQERPEA